MSDVLIIDGYNVIHFSPSMKQTLKTCGAEAARDSLVSYLSRLSCAPESRIIVVFDGKSNGFQGPKEEPPIGVEIVFSRNGNNADTEIERMVYGEGSRKTIVVSADRHLRDICVGLGVTTLSPKIFLEENNGGHSGNGNRNGGMPKKARIGARIEELISEAVRDRLRG